MPGKVDGVALAAIGAGSVFTYAGLKGKSIPSAIQSVVQGRSPATASSANPITGSSGTSAEQQRAQAVLGSGAQGGSVSQNQAIAKMLAASYGWDSGQEWQDLVNLWNRESGWSNTAQNASSGAYGIPQALPYTKMPKAAWPPADGGSADATAQISWGLAYIADRYGSPSAAWAHELSAGWY